jgi:hypothetical protein
MISRSRRDVDKAIGANVLPAGGDHRQRRDEIQPTDVDRRRAR